MLMPEQSSRMKSWGLNSKGKGLKLLSANTLAQQD
jgi:hypothetical protein